MHPSHQSSASTLKNWLTDSRLRRLGPMPLSRQRSSTPPPTALQMWGLLLAGMLLLAIGLGAASSMASAPAQQTTTAAEGAQPSACAPHPHITITEDEGANGFILDRDPATGAPIYRPGSGVIGGDGTPEDPFVIGGWCLATMWPNFDAPVLTEGIVIENTQAHVIVQDNVLTSAQAAANFVGNHGIRVSNAENVTLSGNQVTNQWFGGLTIEDSDHVVIRGNHATGNLFAGILVDNSTDVLIENNLVREQQYGIILHDDVSDVIVRENTAVANEDGILAAHSHTVEVYENEARGNHASGIVIDDTRQALVYANLASTNAFDGIRLLEAHDTAVYENTASQNGWIGVFAQASNGTTIENNVLEENGRDGILLRATYAATVHNNTLVANERDGLRIFDAHDTQLVDNHIEGHSVGMSVDADSTLVDARDNWWGHATGPSGGIEDACSDETIVAEGEGAVIAAQAAVCFAPWHTAPS